jgi:hypothetical protein
MPKVWDQVAPVSFTGENEEVVVSQVGFPPQLLHHALSPLGDLCVTPSDQGFFVGRELLIQLD